MSSKTFLPTLVRILQTVCSYIVRYRKQMLHHLPENGAALLDAVMTACEALLIVIPLDEEL